MNIAIIGAGIVGVTTAHAFSQQGCTVDVYERGSSAAQGASFALSGRLDAQSVAPILDSNAFAELFFATFGRSTYAFSGAGWTIGQYAGLLKSVWAARTKTYETNHRLLQSLAQYSELQQQSEIFSIMFHEVTHDNTGQGRLSLYTSETSLDTAWQAILVLPDAQQTAFKKLTTAQVLAIEPALWHLTTLAGAIVCQTARFGNAALLTKQLKNLHTTPVNYRFNQQVEALHCVNNQGSNRGWQIHSRAVQILGQGDAVLTTLTEVSSNYDAVVLCTGASTQGLLEPLGMRLPWLNVHSYSMTLPVLNLNDSPKHVITVQQAQAQPAAKAIDIVPIGQRVRVSGKLQIAGNTPKIHNAAYRPLIDVLHSFYPYATRATDASYDHAKYAVVPDTLPVLGATPLAGLYLNVAHGPHQGALSFGCAQAVCDLVLNRGNRFDLTPFAVQRYFK